MNQYKVRAHMLGWQSFITKADHYEDFELESKEPLDVFARRLALEGFRDENSGKWIMPGAIAWVEPHR